MGNLFSRCVHNESTAQRQNTYKRNSIGKDDSKPRKPKHGRNDCRENVTITTSVEIKNFSFSIGKNAQNVTINKLNVIEGKRSKKSKTKRSTNGERKDIFTTGYKTPYTEENKQQASDSRSTGNFIDVRNVKLKEFMYKHEDLGKCSDSVCQIRFPDGTGTGFRVGSKYIMTALHVVKGIIDASYQSVESDQNRLNALQDGNVYCIFKHLKRPGGNERRFSFKPEVLFRNEETDTAVLELAEHSEGSPFPPPFERFGFPNFSDSFYLIGHEGGVMKTNNVDKIIDRSHPTTLEDITWVLSLNNEHTDQNYEFPPHSTLSNENRILFHCRFSKGASGSPGVLIMENGNIVVVTLLLCGYPNWRYNEDTDDQMRSNWPNEYCIEQGADMIKVGNFMREENDQLYQDIFCRQLPSPAL
ncbi:uncharacterized protein LOC132754000 isoform X2 [Ruditapes philippinarum]|uniref:uncharacterized protein LOC132754000 isoform X2 n=1 Tax=Ruditapes philippinarum TaxID=129788 RepID=UPI00295C39A0|nr:uncharacterized protein LOC132754000 isoform X2 [Ruditapes philippinarum]